MIEFSNVNFQYASSHSDEVLTIEHLVIPKGQVVLLCGPSGCGKTTLTRLINGLIPHYYSGKLTGRIRVNGKDVSKRPLYATANDVGSVFQNPRTQFFTVNTTNELAFESENQGLLESTIIKQIEMVTQQFDIKDLMGKNIFHLSGGEKQKIACASISVSDPPIVVLDEPSSNLDMDATENLRKMIVIWKTQGKTIVIAEHRLYYLRDIIDRVLYLENGKIKKDSPAQEAITLSAELQIKMGLRPFNLIDFPFSSRIRRENTYFECVNFHFDYSNQKKALLISKLLLPINSIIAVIGHNGAGKSTFARCLCGLEKQCKGIIRLYGKQYRRRQRRLLCYMVMQDVNHQLFAETVETEVMLGAEQIEKIDTILKQMDLYQFKDSHPMALSGGQKQRVAIASALTSDRDILVFDEPTSGLDYKHMKEVADELLAIQTLGKTSLVITHDYELIASCCDYVLHIEEGKVFEQYALDFDGVKRLKRFFGEQGENYESASF